MTAPTSIFTGKESPALLQALAGLDLGLSVIPIAADGSKKPALATWTEYQVAPASRGRIESWFKNPALGLGIVTGKASKNLELFEFDDYGCYVAFKQAALDFGLMDLVNRIERGYSEQTPGGGIHWFYYLTGAPVPGNTKLAQQPKVDEAGNPVLLPTGKPEIKTLIETRGQGGQVVIAPSGGRVHPTGKPYQILAGSLQTIATINPEEHKQLWDLARSFDDMPELAAPQYKDFEPRRQPAGAVKDLRPGDDFNQRADWEHDILGPAGWPVKSRAGTKTFWQRPGKSGPGWSATTGYIGQSGGEVFVCFSSSVPEFEEKKGYGKFFTYARLFHNGDYSAAGKELYLKGYGSRSTMPASREASRVDPETGEIIDDAALADFPPDDEGNALAFMSVYGKDFLYCPAFGYLAWNETHWDMALAEFKLHARVVEVLKRRRVAAVIAEKEAVVKVSVASAAKVTACITMIQPKIAVNVTEFDSEPDQLNVANGVINLRTGDLLPHDKAQRFTYCIETAYNPQADCSTWRRFLNQVIDGGQPVIEYVQMALGYTLTGLTNEECLFYLQGPTRGGKGTFTEVLIKLLGRPLAAEPDFTTFTQKRDADSSNFDMAPLKPARAVFASESNRYQSLNPAKIKQLTGGNEVYCSHKHRDFFNYRPQYKIWLSSNWEANGDPDDDALWGRLKVISFPHSFLGHEDKTLKPRLKSKESLEGVLSWIVEGAIAWYKSLPGGLVAPDAVTKTTKLHRDMSDTVQAWLEECCELDETKWTSSDIVMESYKRWCQANGTEPKQMRALATSLRAKGLNSGVRNRVGDRQVRGVQGLNILN
jgi:putative DNA primase/helicase